MSRLPEQVRATGNAAFILVFAGLIAAPGLASLCGLAPPPCLNEKRRLAPPPELRPSRNVLAAFPAAFDAYFNDHFAFRDQLVYWHNRLLVQAFGVSPCPSLVLIGKDGWLYYVPQALDEYRAAQPFTEAQLAEWGRMLEERQAWLAARGCRFLVVVAPDGQTIYPEHLPAWVKRAGPTTRLDQLTAYVRGLPDLTLLDLREPLRQAKREERVYYRTDTHWNLRGAFAGYQAVAAVLSQWFPELKPLKRSDFAPLSRDVAGQDMAIMLGFPDLYREERLDLAPRAPLHWRQVEGPPESTGPWVTERDGAELPRAIVFHDSFGEGLRPFLSETFGRVVYRDKPTGTAEDFDVDLIAREKPNVVVFEIVERRLMGPTPINPPALDAASDRSAARP